MKSTLPFLFYWLNRVPVNVQSVLDLGTGRGIIGAMLQLYREPPVLQGVDIHPPYAEYAKRFYTSMTIGDAVDVLAGIPSNTFDVVTCFEMIEHLEKEKGYKLISEMERVGRITFISTPSRFFPQPEYDENIHQRHLSLWRGRDFRKLGYDVRGFGGAQWLFGLGPAILMPGLCHNILAWKIRTP